MFSVFGEAQLPPINTNASLAEIQSWKKSKKLKECQVKLFALIKEGEQTTHLTRILDKVWGSKEKTHLQTAYTTTICNILLNPKIEHIQISETVVKLQMKKILVSFRNFTNMLNFKFKNITCE